MGDRLARFGFTVSQGGRKQTVTPGNVDRFIKEQISRSFAFKAAKDSIKSVTPLRGQGLAAIGISSSPQSPIFNQSDVKRIGLNYDPTQQATFAATQQQLGAAFTKELRSRGIVDDRFAPANGFSPGPFNPLGGPTSISPNPLEGAEQFNQQFFGSVFGTGNRILGTESIHTLFKDEKQALGQVDFLFKKGGNALRNEVFSYTQDVANVRQKIRDSKVSGGPLGGVLKVASFGLGVTGAFSALGSKLGVGKALAKVGLSSATQTALPGSAVGALKTTVGTIATTAGKTVVDSTIRKLATPSGETVGVRPGVPTGSQKIAAAQSAAAAPTSTAPRRQSFLSAILSSRSIARINSQRESLGKQNLKPDAASRKSVFKRRRAA